MTNPATKNQKQAHLRVIHQAAPAAAGQRQIMRKWQTADNHAKNDDPLDGDRVECTNRGGAGRVAAGGKRRHRMRHRIKHIHPGKAQHDRP